MFNRRNCIVHLISFCILLVNFLLCRYGFFGLHQMKQWPVFLLIIGLVILAGSFLVKASAVPLVSAMAYLFGFVAALIFQTEQVDPLRGRTNNLWLIWMFTFLGITLVSVFAEIMFTIIKKRCK